MSESCRGVAARRRSVLALWGWVLGVWIAGCPMAQAAGGTDFAQAARVKSWLRHPVYGDPSFDAFERSPANPVHRGQPPYEWPVNGFLFADPVGGNQYIFVGDYGRGYLHPPSRCLLYRSADAGRSWTALGVVLQGDRARFDRGGHTPDVSVVYAAGRYHMVYDWGEPDFTAEGGLAYAWAERPEGPWRRADTPLTRNSTLDALRGRYRRTYAATLVRRAHDWLILAMMDHAPWSWALFAMTAPRPEGPYSERRLVRCVEDDYFHPPLMEFYPAFVHGGWLIAPATSVALNRNFNVLFRAPLERAGEPGAWSVFQGGSVWHAEDVEPEHDGIWGQTFSGFVDRGGMLRVLFPSRDAQGRGTLNLASRPWNRPYRERGLVLTGHQGPSLTLLRRAFAGFALEAQFRLRGRAALLVDYDAPLGPDRPSSDATLHSATRSRHLALELSTTNWQVCRWGADGQGEVLARGALPATQPGSLRLRRHNGILTFGPAESPLWSGTSPLTKDGAATGVLGLRVEADSHLAVESFRVTGRGAPARVAYGGYEALLGAGESAAEWEEVRDPGFRFGLGLVSRRPAALAKWNVVGSRFTLWSPHGPRYGTVEVRLDGRVEARLDLARPQAQASAPLWRSGLLPDTGHAVALTGEGAFPVDCLEAEGEP